MSNTKIFLKPKTLSIYYYGWWNIIGNPQGTLQQYWIEAKNIIFLIFFSLPFFSYSNNCFWQYFFCDSNSSITTSVPIIYGVWHVPIWWPWIWVDSVLFHTYNSYRRIKMFAELKKIYDFLSQRNMMQSKQKFKRKCAQYQWKKNKNKWFIFIGNRSFTHAMAFYSCHAIAISIYYFNSFWNVSL